MEDNTPAEQPKGGFPKSMIAIALVVILVLAGGVYAYNQSQSTNNNQQVISESTQSSPTQTAATPTTAAMMKKESDYKDGTYTVEGEYLSPGGEEQLGVSLTLKDGVITDATVTPKATRPISIKMQTAFSEGYKPLVVGKNIDEVQLDVVSGSSLSPKGFNDAVTKIKEQAKA